MDKHKLVNDYGMQVTLNFKNLNGKIIGIRPHSFSYVSEEELLYLTSTSNVLKKGLLRVDGDTTKLEEVKESINESNVFSEDRMLDLLDMSVSEISKELKNIDNILGLKELLKQSQELDKAKGFINAVSKRIEELR